MAFMYRPRAPKPSNPNGNWRSNGDGSKSQVGDYRNGSYSAGGKTFERDRNNNLIVKRPDGTSQAYAPGTREFNVARRAMEQSGGNWDSMKAIQPKISENGSDRTSDRSDFYSDRAGKFQDQITGQMGIAPRPDPYIKPFATPGDFANTLGNIGEHYSGIQYDREHMGSANDLALRANELGKQNALHNLESGRAKIDQSYDEQERQNYIRNTKGLRALDEETALQGLGGGASESARLAYGNEYQEGMNRIGIGRANAQADLDRQIQSEAFRWDQQQAELQSIYEREKAQAMERGRERAMDWAWRAAEAADEQYWRQKQYEAQQAANDREWAWKERAYNDSRSDYADERDFKQRMYDDEFYGRGFKYDMMRDEMGLKRDKFALQEASRAARAGRRGSGGGRSGGGRSGGSSGYNTVSIMGQPPTEDRPQPKGTFLGNMARSAMGGAMNGIQRVAPYLEEQGRNNDAAFANKWINTLEQAKANLKAGKIDVITYNVIARDAEIALRSAGY